MRYSARPVYAPVCLGTAVAGKAARMPCMGLVPLLSVLAPCTQEVRLGRVVRPAAEAAPTVAILALVGLLRSCTSRTLGLPMRARVLARA